MLSGQNGEEGTTYLGKVLGDATSAVGIRDLGVLQVHNALAHILVKQDSPVMAPCMGTEVRG